jgi:hypothetical protein
VKTKNDINASLNAGENSKAAYQKSASGLTSSIETQRESPLGTVLISIPIL